MMNFIEEMEKNLTTRTENGAIGYVTTGNKLVDLNFKVPELRREAVLNNRLPYLVDLLSQATTDEDKNYVWAWIFYLRDIEKGFGWRSVFSSKRSLSLNKIKSHCYFGSNGIFFFILY